VSGPRERWIWSGVVAALAVTAVASAEVRGRATRRLFDLPPEFEGRPWSRVGNAAARRFAESIGAGFVEVEQ
jgi:hypothetical protein